MSNFSNVASALFSGIDSVIGFGMAGPAVVGEGAKTGPAIGAQIGFLTKGEKTAKAVVAKISSGLDAAGKKIGIVASKSEEAMQKACEVAENCILQIADVWSTIVLCGYVIDMTVGCSHTNINRYSFICETACESLDNITNSMKTFSLNNLAISAIAAAGLAIHKKLIKS